MKNKLIALSMMLSVGCTSLKHTTQTPETREPAQEVSNTPLGEPVAESMGALDNDGILFARRLCSVVDSTQGGSRDACLHVLNDILKSKFNQSSPPPARLDLAVLTCEMVPRRDNFLNTYYLVRAHCLQNAFNLTFPNQISEAANKCGNLATKDSEIAMRRGDCYKRFMQQISLAQ